MNQSKKLVWGSGILQSDGNDYNALVTKPEEKYLQDIAQEIVKRLPEKFEFIDLGPGTAGKEKYIFEAAKKFGKKIVYRPVDISKYYLDKSKKYAEIYELEIKPLNCSFEELPDILKDDQNENQRFVSLGLTVSNFDPKSILTLLKSIAGNNGQIFINSQIRGRLDMERLKKIYSIVNVPERLARLGVKSGDKFLVFQSLRPTLDELKKQLDDSGMSYELFDTGSSFVGTLLRVD